MRRLGCHRPKSNPPTLATHTCNPNTDPNKAWLNVHACVLVCVHGACVCVCVCVSERVCVRVCPCMRVLVCVCVHACVSVHVCVRACARAHVGVRECVCEGGHGECKG